MVSLHFLKPESSYKLWKDALYDLLRQNVGTQTQEYQLGALFDEDPWKDDWPLGLVNNYHNYGHLLDVAGGVAEESLPTRLPVRLAAMYHDYGYDPTKSGKANIEASCVRLKKDMAHMHASDSFTDRVICALKSTEDHFRVQPGYRGRPSNLARQDLSILFGDKDTYKLYSEAIRKEYSHVSDDDYRVGRSKVLNKIAKQAVGSGFYTKAALSNISNEIQSLKKPKIQHVLYAGCFDPFHKGHAHVIREALKKGLKVTVAVMSNSRKKAHFGSARRVELVRHDLRRMELDVSAFAGTGNTMATLAKYGCDGLLRGVREDDPASVNEENNRAIAIKAETGLNTVLIPTRNKVASYSSTSAKEAITNMCPAKMVSAVTRSIYEDNEKSIVLVVGGIASGKSTFCVGGEDRPAREMIDMDEVAKRYLAKHPVFGVEDLDKRYSHFESFKSYMKYMQRVKPFIMAGLQKEIQLKKSPGTIYVQVNKLGLLWDELLRMSNYSIIYLEDVSDLEAIRRVKKRGSSQRTLELIRALETHAPSFEEMEQLVKDKTMIARRNSLSFDGFYVRRPE